MLRNCHGHNLSKGNIIKIFYHGLSEITQEVLNAAAGGIFLYKTPNQAYQLLEDKVLLKLDWAKNQKTKSSLKKTVAFADEGSSNSNTDKIMARMDAMTLKMDAQYKELQSNAKKQNPILMKIIYLCPEKRKPNSCKPSKQFNDFMKSQQTTNAFVKETFMDLKTQLETVAKNHQASIQNLETKFDRLADKQSGRPSGSLPSNTQPNPKGHNSKAYQPPQSRNEHVNAVFTRSGKSYNPPVNPNDQQNDSETPINFDSDDENEEPTPQPKTQNPKPTNHHKTKNYVSSMPKERENGSSIRKISRHDLRCLNQSDLGASINLMPYSLYAKLSLKNLKPTKISVRLANRSFQYPVEIAENMLVEVGKFTFPADFVILEMEEDSKVPFILGRPFLHTADAVIRVKQKQLNLGVGTERMIFNIDSAMKHSYSNDDTCFSIDVIDEILEEDFDALLDEGSKILHSIEGTLLKEEIFAEFDEFIAMTADENSDSESDTEDPPFEKITINTDYKIKTSLEEPPMDLELKPLLDNLEYVFLEEPSFLPVIISSQLTKEKKNKLISVLKKYKQAFAWKQLTFLVSAHHSANTRYNFLMTRNPLSKTKEGGITVFTNENDELVPTRTVTGWRVCIDYHKLNEATAKDHFPLPFMDQMLERLAGNKYFCFLDGFSGYFQIPIDPNDQEKTTFTCPFRTYAYRRMPFGLCNAPATFQRCMLAIFHDMIEESVEEKCHFMVKEGIVLGHKVSSAGLEVDKAKINVILKLPPPNNIKDTPFEFDDECQKAFESLKEKLTYAPVIISLNWNFRLNLCVMQVISQLEPSYVILSKTIVHTDHSALKHLFKKQDAKPHLIQWILLLQEFDIEIKDKKGIENVVDDHLSRIDNNESSDDNEVDGNFPRETLMEINTKNEPWLADFVNYLVGDIIPKRMMYQQKNKFFSDLKYYSGRNPIFSKYVLTV
ncbi:reverse transcriptase domain-containing protein [Tanacetum coccineum]